MAHRDTRAALAVARALRPELRDPPGYALRMVEQLSEPHRDGHGYAHRLAVVLAPRRVVKTTTLLDLTLARMRLRAGFRASYTAQTGHDTSAVFTEPGALLDQIAAAPRLRHMRGTRSQGRERVTYRKPGRRPSFLGAFAPVPGKLRGRARELVLLDEAQELDDVGAELVADVWPTGDTLGSVAQVIVSGTAGYGPGWWRDLVDRGRAGELLLVELGSWPRDADPDDERVWAAYHPGLRAGLTTLEALRGARAALGADRFAREYGNVWGASDSAAAPIPLDLWAQLRGPAALDDRPVAAGFDVTVERDSCSLVGVTEGGHVRLLATGPVKALPELVHRLARGLPVAAGPNQRQLVERLQRAGVPASTLTLAEYRAACQLIRDRVQASTVSHDGQPELDAAVSGAGRVWHGDAWVLSARRSGTDVTPLVAAAVALYQGSRVRVPRVVGSAQTTS